MRKIRSCYRNFFNTMQRKVLFIVTLVLSVLFLVAFLGINQIVENERYETLSEQYSYLNDKVVSSFENIKNELDALTEEFILNEYVQKTLTNQSFTASDREMMKKGLAFYSRSYLDYYLLIDNKGNQYSQRAVELDLEKFQRSLIYKNLGEEYSRTKILWARDVIFGTNEMSYFAIRYVRSLNYNHEPGILILKLNDNLMKDVRENIVDERLMYFILDMNQQVCFSQIPEGGEWNPDNAKNRIMVWNEITENAAENRENLNNGLVCWRYDDNTQFTIITYVPGELSDSVVRQIRNMIVLVFLVTYAAAIIGTLILTRKLVNPIRYLSETMSSFDESHLENRIELDTNTELDQIGQAYNQMVVRVKDLMSDVRQKESALRKSELDSLMYQIRPHFLYNTLDTIYMLARIQKEETIMRMIQSLSRFLRINLSNGNEKIEVQRELEHVSSYLEIQKIRNADLFTYEIEMDETVAELPVMKMILQPVAENCIKYGFRDIEEDGKIRIAAWLDGDEIQFVVENNGATITDEALKELNRLESIELEMIDQVIRKKQGGYGIRNVVKRLRLRYGNSVRFRYSPLKEGTRCEIRIPIEKMEDDAAIADQDRKDATATPEKEENRTQTAKNENSEREKAADRQEKNENQGRNAASREERNR